MSRRRRTLKEKEEGLLAANPRPKNSRTTMSYLVSQARATSTRRTCSQTTMIRRQRNQGKKGLIFLTKTLPKILILRRLIITQTFFLQLKDQTNLPLRQPTLFLRTTRRRYRMLLFLFLRPALLVQLTTQLVTCLTAATRNNRRIIIIIIIVEIRQNLKNPFLSILIKIFLPLETTAMAGSLRRAVAIAKLLIFQEGLMQKKESTIRK